MNPADRACTLPPHLREQPVDEQPSIVLDPESVLAAAVAYPAQDVVAAMRLAGASRVAAVAEDKTWAVIYVCGDPAEVAELLSLVSPEL